ncbi:hypothetical protein CRUP_036163 [Coryphaenoides rupestris]|nr:hypothetical protein CRUP_036163 [Coryphaenoides rupestris]
MKHRWSLLPTITETLEDCASPLLQLPAAAAAAAAHHHQPTPASPASASPSPSADDYMASIQALARPLEAPVNFGPVRLQRSARPRLFAKGQAKHSGASAALLPRGSPRSARTSGLSLAAPERVTLRTMGDRDCKGRDPVDWLYGQAQMRT